MLTQTIQMNYYQNFKMGRWAFVATVQLKMYKSDYKLNEHYLEILIVGVYITFVEPSSEELSVSSLTYYKIQLIAKDQVH